MVDRIKNLLGFFTSESFVRVPKTHISHSQDTDMHLMINYHCFELIKNSDFGFLYQQRQLFDDNNVCSS